MTSDLQERGWSKLPSSAAAGESLEARLFAVANSLGTPIGGRSKAQLIEVLKPTNRSQANPNSLSSQYSTGEFPLHADTAHWPIPCRYVLLGCVNRGTADRASLLLDTTALPFHERELDLLQTTPFRITNGRASFFSTILSNKRKFIRIDPGCMSPVTHRGNQALATLGRERWPEQVFRSHWAPGDILIIDNWRVLHGRESSSTPDKNRELIRMLIR